MISFDSNKFYNVILCSRRLCTLYYITFCDVFCFESSNFVSHFRAGSMRRKCARFWGARKCLACEASGKTRRYSTLNLRGSRGNPISRQQNASIRQPETTNPLELTEPVVTPHVYRKIYRTFGFPISVTLPQFQRWGWVPSFYLSHPPITGMSIFPYQIWNLIEIFSFEENKKSWNLNDANERKSKNWNCENVEENEGNISRGLINFRMGCLIVH